MDPIVKKIAEGFGIKPKSITKSKYYYIVKTDRASYTLRQVHCSHNLIEEINDIKDVIVNNGFNSVDKYIISEQKKPYFYYDSCNYVLTKALPYQELELLSTAEVGSAVGCLGRCHLITRGYTRESDFDILAKYESEKNKLFQIKKYISKKSHLSDTDVIFLKNYDYYFNLCEQALSILKNSGYVASEVLVSFCHNAFKEDNVLVSNKNVYITNWEKLSHCHFTKDLSSFINRYVKKIAFPFKDTMPTLGVRDIIDIYCDNNPLDDIEMAILRAELVFPEKFISICSDYYNKNRSWTPISVSAQLESIIKQKSFYKDYINTCL